jgi:hypothetical protein
MRAFRELVAAIDALLGPSVVALAGVASASVLILVLWARPACACSSKAAAYRTAMRSDLRNMVTAQEAHFAKHSRYATQLPSHAFRLSTGVQLLSMTVGTQGFMAVVAYPSRTSTRCWTVYARGREATLTCDTNAERARSADSGLVIRRRRQ